MADRLLIRFLIVAVLLLLISRCRINNFASSRMYSPTSLSPAKEIKALKAILGGRGSIPFNATYSSAISERTKDRGLKLVNIVGISTGCIDVVLLP